jgi:hypothetical protein
VSVLHVDVVPRWRKSGYVDRCAVMRLGWPEEAFRNGEVVAADAEWILGDDASKSVQLDPLQGGVTVLEHTRRKSCLLAVEDPNGWCPDLSFGIVFSHEKNVYIQALAARPGMLI